MALDILGTPTSTNATSVDPSSTYSTYTYTVSAGSRRLLILFIGEGTSTGSPGAATVTYGTQSMTQIPGYLATDSNFEHVQAWYLKETGIAAASSTTFAVTWTDTATTIQQLAIGAALFQDVDQTTTFRATANTNTASSSSPSVTVTSESGDLVVASIATDENSTLTEGKTLIYS